MLQDHPHLTTIIPFDRSFLAKAWYHPKAFAAFISLIRRLRRNKFDVVIDLQGLFRTASLAWLSGCKKRLGMANARELAHIFYTDKVRQTSDCVHLVDYYLRIAQAAGASDIAVEFVLPQDPDATDLVNRLLTDHNIKPNNYAVFVPGSTDSDKRWPIERFAALADKIAAQFHLSLIAIGSTSESSTIKMLKRFTTVPIANLAGRTSLSELIALLRAAKLVVSNDTGPGHIAAVLGTPLVLMYSWSNPARIAPYGRAECMVAREPYSRGPKIKSLDPRHSISTITVDEVFQKVREQLNA